MNTRATVVVSHPHSNSFNHALAEAVVSAWTSLGLDVTLSDLHAVGFDPVLTEAEARGLPCSDPCVLQQIGLLTSSSFLAVIHPNCWGAPPAMMKGWMDRVFAPGAAYAFPKGSDDGQAPEGLFHGKRALVLNTSNTTEERERAAFGDPLETIWKNCLLGYCGFDLILREVFRVFATSTARQREQWLERAGTLAVELVGPFGAG